jgi:MerR family copper efflux transcriptional regulator
MRTLTIGQVARMAGVRVDTIRYYERRGLLPAPERRPTLHGPGYRRYDPGVVRRIRFIRQAQRLGFSLQEIAELLALRVDPWADRREVRRRVAAKVADLEARIRALEAMRQALRALMARCEGSGPVCECPILEALEGEALRSTF